MICEEMPELLSAVADGEAEAWESVLVAEHLRDCAACRGEMRLLRGLKAAVRRVELPPLPADLEDALLREAARRAHPAVAGIWARLAQWLRARPPRYAAAGFAAAALLLALRLAAGRDEEVPLSAILAAHDEYALTMPLASREQLDCQLSEAIAAEGRGDEL